MEFGKKGDAKKAMKMMWREGITLKQAWKRVKGGKSPKRSKKCVSPKKRKAVSNAKKAMRMHHREGITLKQAWKRVNRFGYSVCPPGEVPNPNWAKSGGRGKQCRKACPIGTVRNYNTGRCRKIMDPDAVVPPGYEPNILYSIGSDRQPFVRICPIGMTRDFNTGRCKNILPKLKPGYEINPETGRQRKMCGPGQYRDPITGYCRKIKAPATDASIGFMDDDAEYMVFGNKRAGMAGRYMRSAYFGKNRVHTPMKIPALDQAFGKGLGSDSRGIMRKTKFGTNERRCGFGACTACRGAK